VNVAGLFFSKKKCPTQANPYPMTGSSQSRDHCRVAIDFQKKKLVDESKSMAENLLEPASVGHP
jgi:hypothetical protein